MQKTLSDDLLNMKRMTCLSLNLFPPKYIILASKKIHTRVIGSHIMTFTILIKIKKIYLKDPLSFTVIIFGVIKMFSDIPGVV